MQLGTVLVAWSISVSSDNRVNLLFVGMLYMSVVFVDSVEWVLSL